MTALQGNTDEHKYYQGVRSGVDENGEPIIIAPGNGQYKIVSLAQQEALKRQREREKGRKCEFTFSDMDAIKDVITNVAEKHCGYLLYLQCFIGFDGVIRHASRENNPMTRDDIMSKLGIKKDAFHEYLLAMTSNNIILVELVDGVKQYHIDKRYHWRGSTNNPHVIKSFIANVKKLYKDVGVKDLGFVYKLLPYVHFETNYICSNPYEIYPDRLKKLNRSDLANLTGEGENTVLAKIKKMHVGDEPIFATVRAGKSVHYMVNPSLFYRRDGAPDSTLIATFANAK